MPSILDLLRLHNVFAPQQPMGNDLPSQGGISGQLPTGLEQNSMPVSPMPDPTHSQDVTDISELFKQIYSPDNTASDKVKEILGQMPERQNPNLIHKILGSVVGLGYGPQAGYEAANAPYLHQMEDWKAKLDPWQKESISERQQNTQERIAANDVTGKALADKKINLTDENNKAKIKISQQRADAYVWDKTHPDHIIKEDASGHLIAVNKKDGTAEVVTDSDGDPIKSANLSDEQKLAIQHGNKLSEIQAQGQSNINLENTRESNRQKDIKQRGSESIQLKQTPAPPKVGSSITAKTESASQQRVRIANNAQKYINEHPEAKNWISIDNGQVTIAPIKTGIFGVGGNSLTDQKRKEIQDYIYGGSTGSVQAPASTGQQMKVIDKSDPTKVFMVPFADLDKVDKNKYTVQVP